VSAYELRHSSDVERMPLHFQTTLRHELGHAFGLPHVEVYGYDQGNTPSIMAYYRPFRAVGFRRASVTPRFIPEDLRGLALNPSVFDRLEFNQRRDMPAGYRIHARVIPLGPMKLPGHPDYEPVLQTESGEHRSSKIADLNTRDILPSVGPGVNFYDRYMWMSSPAERGDPSMTVRFPVAVRLSRMTVHTQHGGRWNGAKAIRIEALADGESRSLVSTAVTSPDFTVEFPETESRAWRLGFTVEPGEKVCVRGLQYFSGETHVFPPRVPYGWRKRLGIDAPVFPDRKE
jgi:hypothetical protein